MKIFMIILDFVWAAHKPDSRRTEVTFAGTACLKQMLVCLYFFLKHKHVASLGERLRQPPPLS